MAKKPSDFKITEIGGNQYKSLQEAQTAALPAMADHYIKVLNELLEKEQLIIVDGKVIPAPSGKSE